MDNIIEVNSLVKHYPIKAGVFQKVVGHVKSVDGVSFSIPRGKTFGLVGESGCGKTTIGRTLLRLTEPTSGEAILNGQDIFKMSKKRTARDTSEGADDISRPLCFVRSAYACRRDHWGSCERT